jgi:murein DD-endopeptidase MepM/ murein hydrolase activator NlpD
MNRRAFVAGALTTPALLAAAPALTLNGRFVQGGFAMGRTTPRAELRLDGASIGQASEHGLFIIGFDRDAARNITLETGSERRILDIAIGHFDEQRVSGLPTDQVSPSDPVLLERIRREVALKTQAFASRDDSEAFAKGFSWPLERFTVSGRFGNRRILNGEPKRPHYGIDLAAPQGATIRAPADGLVVLAEPNLHFEGGLTLIDHGQGLVSACLHQSKVGVRAGERVRRGQVIGAVGKTGRATGPHLCWRLKWRDCNLDPSLLIGQVAPD